MMLALLAVIAVAVLAARLYMDRASETAVLPTENIAINSLRGPLAMNAFLACPPGYCAVAPPLTSPEFPIPVERLYDAWLQTIADEPRVTVLDTDPQRRRVIALQRSALFRFPDIIIAEFVALGPQQSSLAVYSRSRYGQSDLGVNRKRVVAWLNDLRRSTPPAIHP